MGMFSSLRQLFYPPEFRIAPIKPLDLTTYLKVIANLLDKNDIPETTRQESIQFLIDLSISFWRLRKMLLKPGTAQPLGNMRNAYNSLVSPWNSLTQAGIMIRDHTNLPYDSGLSLTVISVKETTGLTEPKVIETVKPSIYFQGSPIFNGEVIVGVPVSAAYARV